MAFDLPKQWGERARTCDLAVVGVGVSERRLDAPADQRVTAARHLA
jgi:hypothetical protein